MDIKGYLNKADDFLKQAQKFHSDSRTMVHEIGQAKNDHESLLANIAKRREELAALEIELKTRASQVEAGLSRLADEANRRIKEAEAMKREAASQLEAARRERAIAEQLRESAEKELKAQREAQELVTSVRSKRG